MGNRIVRHRRRALVTPISEAARVGRLHFAWYNFVRIHSSLRVTPAMAAGVTDRVWYLTELLV